MDFFEHQQRSRRRSRWLVVLFAVAVTLTAVGVALVVALFVHAFGSGSDSLAAPDARWLSANRDLIYASAALTVIFIGGASWLRLLQLRSGGSQVAESLGGTRIQPGDPDPARQRLYNVVEEMAVASGLPVPAVFVLERESGINAFAAGLTPSDAAVAVTRGCLLHLSRDELQGVVGHEFSHILHGDMTLNLRLVGYLFGILVVNMLGRAMLRVGSRRSVTRRRGRGQLVIILAGFALYTLGYAGVVAGRIIQAAVCRQREFLADASSVQFTRQTDGLADALRKIAGLNRRSYLRSPRAEEVSHMLFAAGRRAFPGLFATHPSIKARLQALQPHRTPESPGTEPLAAPSASVAEFSPAAVSPVVATRLPESVGRPGAGQIQFAQSLPESLPPPIWEAAHRIDGGTPLILALMLDRQPRIRAHQLSLIEVRFGAPVTRAADALSEELRDIDDDARLALLDVAFPTVRNLQPARRAYLLETTERLAELDGRWAPFETALVAVLRSRMQDLSVADRARPDRQTSARAAADLIAGMALLGHDRREAAERAYRDGIRAAGPVVEGEPGALPTEAPAPGILEESLEALDGLTPLAKRRLISGLAAAAASDGQVAARERALLRAACSALHCPLPPLPGRRR
jgi:Zn-dependent protease with chaperone function